MKIGACAAADVRHQIAWPLLRPLGLQVARCWYDLGGFVATAANRNIARQCDFAAATGIELFWTFGQEGLHLIDCVSGWVDTYALRAARNLRDQYDARPALRGKTIRVAIGNECNLVNVAKKCGVYWKHPSLDGYTRSKAWIDMVQRRMYQVMKSELGDRIEIGAMEFTWDYATLEKLADQMMSCSDFFCFHPYPNSINDTKKITEPVKTAHSRSRKIVFPEAMANCGPRRRRGQITLSQALAEARWLISACAAAGVDEIHLFPCYDQGTSNSWAALLKRIVKNNVTVAVEKGPGYSLLEPMERKAA